MKRDDLSPFEAAIRDANPVPRPADLADSPESAAVMSLVRQRRRDMTTTRTRQPPRVEPPRGPRYSARAFGAAFALILAVVGVAIFALQGDDAPVSDQPVTTGITQPPPPVDTGPITWTRVDMEDGFVPAVVPLGDGFVGTRLQLDGSGVPSQIVTSPDGIVWSPVVEGAVDEGYEVVWAHGGPWGAVGEMRGPGDPEIIMTRDGVTWVRSNPAVSAGLPTTDLGIQGLTGGEPGLVVVYHSPGEEGPEVFVLHSPDGESWTRVVTPPRLGFFTAIGSSPAGYLMFGETIGADETGNDNTGLGAWLSDDGTTWHEVTVSDQYIMGGQAPVSWRGGFIFAGDTFDHATETVDTHIWQTTDGENWVEMDTGPFEQMALIGPFKGSDRGILAAAADETSVYLLFSEDGVEWSTRTAKDLFGTSDVLWNEAAGSGDRFVVPVMSGGGGLWVGVVAGD